MAIIKRTLTAGEKVDTQALHIRTNRIAIVGGILGLLPFWGMALVDMWANAEVVARGSEYLANYAALILTFVGAIWWGIALNAPQALLTSKARGFLFGWSLAPCVLAWFLLMVDQQFALLGLAFLLVLQLILDFIFLWRAQLIAQWFWRLRVVLTCGAVPALLVGASV